MTNQLILRAPVSGVVYPLERVPDPVFAQKLTGDGLSIDPIDGRLARHSSISISISWLPLRRAYSQKLSLPTVTPHASLNAHPVASKRSTTSSSQ
jgi:hypothetical protein